MYNLINDFCSNASIFILLLGFPAIIIWFIVSFVKKKNWKNPLKAFGISIVAIIVLTLVGSSAWTKTEDYQEYLAEEEIKEKEEAKKLKEKEEKAKLEKEEEKKETQTPTPTKAVEATPTPTPEPTKKPKATKTPTPTPTEEMKKEIVFMDTPWGTSCEELKNKFPDYKLMCLSGEHYKTMSCDAILLGDYKGIDFEYSDINIVGSALNEEVEVAGYVTSDLNFYFSYIPVDGVLTKTEKDSSFYGAQYVFSPKDLKNMQKDLLEKLTSLYGEPSKSNKDSDLWGNKFTYTYWYGANDTELVLKTQDSSEDSTELYEDEICISYVWRKGDELLQNASDILKEEAIKKEAEAYENTNTDGL